MYKQQVTVKWRQRTAVKAMNLTMPKSVDNKSTKTTSHENELEHIITFSPSV